MVEAAAELGAFLSAQGFAPWPKTTGGKGLHLVVPIEPTLSWKEAAIFAREVAQDFAAGDPARFTAVAGAKARAGGKIFVDWLRNGRGSTALGAMSPRARAGGLVSMPVSFEELAAGLDPATLTLRAAARRVKAVRL